MRASAAAGPPSPRGGLDIVVLNWRDLQNPEGGGSERYVETVAQGLVRAGHRVTLLCAAHSGAPGDEVVGGVRVVRSGGKLTVYPRALWGLWRRRRTTDVVVDVQNGIPFFSRLVTRRPVVVLVHHVHREQWPVVFGPSISRVGWWIESWAAPRLYRRSQYVAVSAVTRDELATLGVEPTRVAVVHNGTDIPPRSGPRDERPTLCVVSRLVPHKRLEHALRVTAGLRHQVDGLRLIVVGDGWWSDSLMAEARRLGVADITRFTGFVDEPDKHRLLASAWVHLAPSLKEGWGLTVMEAASHGVPTVAYRGAGGLSESVVDGTTGLLVTDPVAFTDAVKNLLLDRDRRERMGQAARERALSFRWERSVSAFERVLRQVVAGERVSGVDVVDTGQAIDLTTVRGAEPRALRHGG